MLYMSSWLVADPVRKVSLACSNLSTSIGMTHLITCIFCLLKFVFSMPRLTPLTFYFTLNFFLLTDIDI